VRSTRMRAAGSSSGKEATMTSQLFERASTPAHLILRRARAFRPDGFCRVRRYEI